jgi:hypothetical protein
LAEGPATVAIIAKFREIHEIRETCQLPRPVSNSISIVCEWTAVCHNAAMACRIDRLTAEGDFVVLRISGRITQDDIPVFRAAIDQERGALAIDLAEVGLVDRDAVNLLAFSEAKGIALRNTPPYIREWVDRERAQTPPDSSAPGK